MESVVHKTPGEHIDTLAFSEREDEPRGLGAKYCERSSYSEDAKLQPAQAKVSPETRAVRTLCVGPKTTPGKFCSNRISTAKYSLLSWAPKSLLQQFRRAANVYFLAISVLSFMPFSPKTPVSMAGTFSAVLVFTMLKEAFEDIRRHRQDSTLNQIPTQRFNDSTQSFEDVKSQDIRVCDFVKVRENEALPADLLLLSCSNEKGVAYVNTMNLDGETNLKEKTAHKLTKKTDLKVYLTRGIRIECDVPNPSLIAWNCKMKLAEGGFVPMSVGQLLLRGCVLKNTDYVIGIVLYTGAETKVMLNSKPPPSKVSNVLRTMNKMLYTVFAFQAVICLLFAGLNFHWGRHSANKHLYMSTENETSPGHYFVQILTYYIAYSHMIPISLYVALEVLKLALAYLISQDQGMYHEEDNRRASCRTSDLVEELGQAEFLFSDKTGTLTRNVMELRKCSINGVVYGGYRKEPGIPSVSGDQVPASIMDTMPMTDPERAAISRFFTQLAVCHAVFPASVDGQRKYQAASPDDLALVQSSADMRFVFEEREDNLVKVRYAEFPEDVWEVLAELPFDSDRKRMSVLVKEPHSQRVLLMSKGADAVLFARMRADEDLSVAEKHVNSFALEGLRTLVVAQRYVEEGEARGWLRGWEELSLSAAADKDTLLHAHADLIEKDLELVGITAIEDELQAQVPETIKLLLDANIRVWVLTGDKQETAVQIGTTCQLLRRDMKLLDLSSNSQAEFAAKLQDYTRKYVPATQGTDIPIERLDSVREDLAKKGTKLGIVINGATLAWVLGAKSPHRSEFFKLGFVSQSCVCCRVSPAQKMEVVRLAKEHGNWVTVAIGDGANDVSMIQEAHIGVGIAGKEGSQAVQASDFSFSQFQYLQRLLLVHGRWSYRRVSWFICYYFYKNIAVVFTEIWFALFNGFSGQIFFVDWLPQLYNSLWTSWPCMFTFVFERDLTPEESIKYPVTYRAGQKRLYFTFKRLWQWLALGIFHGIVCFWLPAHGLSISSDGTDTGLWWTSTLSFTLIVHTVTYKLFLESVFWTKVNMCGVCSAAGAFSIVLYYATVALLSFDPVAMTFQPQLNQLVFRLLSNGHTWIVIIVTPLVALLPDLILASWRALFRKSPVDHLLEKRLAERQNSSERYLM